MGDLLTPREVRRLLAERGLAPRKAAGQNFVVDPNTVRRIVDAAGLRGDDVVLEIGPGLGSLTLGLADTVRRVVAVEIDAGFVAALAEVLRGRDDVEVVHADALQADLGALVGGGPARLVANLPYNVATPLIMHALEDPAVDDLFVMVQREVGERWAAVPGDSLYAAVSCKLGTVANAEVALTIPRTVFHPVPNVDSVMVRITRRADAPAGEVRARRFRLIETAFRQRRKTLRNNLRHLAPGPALAAAASDAGIDLGARAERLSPADVERLDAALAAAGVSV
ncbi:16S rRNA (adenine(1518)-N(6)/adenine(1519)-N(6))-dimethyltransferase RsmA [Egicoccus sp. AB-alg2]|uniref:16S rRNA (adenine(1518)-N(6)/adenine(1519)-N(6))- dimethyltransferase RsmA n=1 Tax=Egicoccus sp. AB-alg2 TaxID=3242693 RepID=UPI00359EE091